MRTKKHATTKSGDLFRARLDQIINLTHELAARRQAGTASGREPARGACERSAADPRPARVTVDTTVQPKNITFPTDAKLLHAAIKGLNQY